MTTKCTGLIGRIFGHKWIAKITPVAATPNERGVFFMHGIGPLKMERQTLCKRCGTVAGGNK